jgi:hypothetical protein
MDDLLVEEFNVKVDELGKVRAEWLHPLKEADNGVLDLDNLKRRTIDVLVDLLRKNKLHRHEELKVLGDLLFTALFGASNEGRYESGQGHLLSQAIKSASAPGSSRLLRISLEIDPANGSLVSWPWEYLHVPYDAYEAKTDMFLGEEPGFMLTRKLALRNEQEAVQVQPPLRVLFVALSPEGGDAQLERIQYESVMEDLIAVRDLGLDERDNRDRINLVVLTTRHDLEGKEYPDGGDAADTHYGTFRRLVQDWQPHVVHIVAHGRHRYNESEGRLIGEIAFRAADGKVQWVDEQAIAGCVASSNQLCLVFLQACESGETGLNPYHAVSGMAQAVARREIPAVVAMQFKVNSARANMFARVFYGRLMKRDRIELAMHEGVRELSAVAVGTSGRSDFGIPVLYLRGNTQLLAPIPVPTRPDQHIAAERIASWTDQPPESAERPSPRYIDPQSKTTVDDVTAERTGYFAGGQKK